MTSENWRLRSAPPPLFGEVSHNAHLHPSTCTSDFWIYARNNKSQNNQEPGDNCGKWMIFEPFYKIDEVWSNIKAAVEKGLLGHSAKVATIKDKEDRGGSSNQSVICIYTYDWTNTEDVMRVRQQLREMGFTNKLSYKSDADTLAGKYRATGHKNISKYRC